MRPLLRPLKVTKILGGETFHAIQGKGICDAFIYANCRRFVAGQGIACNITHVVIVHGVDLEAQ